MEASSGICESTSMSRLQTYCAKRSPEIWECFLRWSLDVAAFDMQATGIFVFRKVGMSSLPDP